MCLSIRWVGGLQTNMTANKSSKAVPRAGGGKAPRDVPDRSVTSGTGAGWLMCTSSHITWFQSIYLTGSFVLFDLKEKQLLYLSVHSFSTTSFEYQSVVGFLFSFPLMGKDHQWLSVTIRLPKLLQVRSCILDKGPIQLWAVSSELKLVLACWELTMSCRERKTNFGNDMWYLDYSFLQFIILSIFKLFL